jgi:hypothetical protein
MKLRFEVDQAACFRKGIDCPKSIVTIEVNPAEIPVEERILIADRLHGIDVCQLWNSNDGTTKQFTAEGHQPIRIVAEEPNYASLVTAVRADQAQVESRLARHRAVALSGAEAGLDLASAEAIPLKAVKSSRKPKA